MRAARQGRRGEELASLAGLVVIWTWPLVVFLAGAGGCPQGDPKTWVLSHLLGLWVLIIALPLLLVTTRVRRWRWTALVALWGPLVLRAPELAAVAGGRHLCGPEWPSATYTDWTAVHYVPAMVVYAIVLSVAACVPYLRSPAEG